MSEKVNKLKIEKTIKEYGFLKSEYNYIDILSDEADKEFMDIVRKYLNDKPALKEIYENKESIIIEDNLKRIKNKLTEILINENDADKLNHISIPKSKRIKNLYREIVKKTHPDKIDDKELNELYMKATNNYDNDDLTSLYEMSYELGIIFEINEDELNSFIDMIIKIKGDIDILKRTYAYRWSQSNNSETQNDILLDFIKMKIS